VAVEDVLSATNARPHVLTAFAVVDGSRISYPATEEQDTSVP
jgi:hypothetical protein